SFMTLHECMSLLSLAHVLLDQRMQKRFEAEPLFRAAMLLLHERIPRATRDYAHIAEFSDAHAGTTDRETPVRIFTSPSTPTPEIQLLSNGSYHVMITNAGSGYSRWKDLAITRWREDPTRDNWGTVIYLRDVKSGEVWSIATQPTTKQTETNAPNFM